MDDLDYLMSMYPSGVKMIQQYVSEACDRMEYQTVRSMTNIRRG